MNGGVLPFDYKSSRRPYQVRTPTTSMASLIVGAGLLIHDKIKSDKAKRRDKKRKAYEARYTELEKEHAAYIERRATGDGAVLDGSRDTQSPTSDVTQRRSSHDSSRDHEITTDEQDGPAKWVEEAMTEKRSATQ
jgi:hypothetical protein